MRALKHISVVIAAIVACDAQAQSAHVEVRRAMAQMNSAAAALDADAFMAWYWKSPSLVITFDGEVMHGWQNILSAQRKWWSDKNSGIAFSEEREPEIVSQGPAVLTSIQWMSVRDAKRAKPSRLIITSVWRKRPEGWRIVLAHESLIPSAN
jgi:uncharacterized protein (TIGR02246 family)